MEPIMVDDSTVSSPASPDFYGSALLAEMSKISTFKVTRCTASKWAQNLNFLVYDDSGDTPERGESCPQGSARLEDHLPVPDPNSTVQESNDDPTFKDQEVTANHIPTNITPLGLSTEREYSLENHDRIYSSETDDDQQKTDYAIALSLAEDEDNQNIVEMKSTAERQASPKFPHQKRLGVWKRVRDRFVECDDERESGSCHKCQKFSTFPPRQKSKTFSIVRGIECSHYVAISYCWPKDEVGEPIEHIPKYRVRTRDQQGKLIARGNRAPNDVIDRAVEFAKSQGIRLIWLDKECLPQDNSKEQELGIQGMDMVYQRAYCSAGLFESVLHHQSYLNTVASVLDWGMSGELLTKPPGLSPNTVARDLVSFLELLGNDQWNTRAWIFQESFAAGERMMVLIRTEPNIQFPQPNTYPGIHQIIGGTFNCVLSDLQRLVEISRRWLVFRVYRGIPADRVVFPPGPEQKRAANAIAKLERLLPKAAKYESHANLIFITGGLNFGERKTCSAAVALTFLRTRLNFRPADRLAILANICDYEVRLSTVDLETRFQSLSTCLFTLAIMNGDLSLLNPDAYQALKVQAPVGEISWLPPYKAQLASIDANGLRPGQVISLRTPSFYRISKEGLTCPAYLWEVNRTVDLTPVKLRYQGDWAAVKSYEITNREKEAEEDFRKRAIETSRRISQRNEQLRQGNSEGWSPDDDPTVIGKVYAVTVDNDKPAQSIVGKILVGILRHLHAEGEIALANSIWHSIRVDELFKPGQIFSSNNLPDDVGDLLLRDDLIRNPWQLFQLDHDRHESYNQVWLVDRIMQYGSVWVGHYLKRDCDSENFKGETEVLLPSSIEQPESSQVLKMSFGIQTILQIQFLKQLLASQFRTISGENDVDVKLSSGVMVGLSYTMVTDIWSEEAEARRAQRVSVFDVDGPCTIATPFDSDNERLPHSKDRSMSICWIVEPVNQKENEMQQKTDIANSPKYGEPDMDGKVAGKQAEAVPDTERNHMQRSRAPLSAFNALKRPASRPVLDAENSHGLHQSDNPSDHASLDENEGRSSSPLPSVEPVEYRVLRKVKGMWEIMDDPIQKYLFV